jgi:hypothetical protein
MANGQSFWNSPALEPKRGFRWYLEFNGVKQWMVKTVKKPSFTVSESTHKFLNYSFNYPGRVEWTPVEITLVDPVQPDATYTMYKMLLDSGYVLPSAFDANAMKSISKASAVSAFCGPGDASGVGAASKIYITQVNHDGVPIEKWALNNPFITSATFGDLTYENEEIVSISLTIKYDWADQETEIGLHPKNRITGTYQSPTE